MTKRKLSGATAMIAVAFLLLTGFAPGVWAQAQKANIQIPFDFYVDATALPAGNYWIEQDLNTRAMRIVGPNGRVAAVVPLVSTGQATDKTRLVFNRYGNTHFLSQLQWAFSDTAFKIRESKLEHEARLTTSPLQVGVNPRN